MGKLIKTKPSICRSCQYHMGFGCQQGKSCLEKYEFNNVACNYLAIMGHSRIFEDGKPTYDPKYCNKFKKGEKAQEPWRDTYYLGAECDEYTEYKCQKMRKEGHYKHDYRNRG